MKNFLLAITILLSSSISLSEEIKIPLHFISISDTDDNGYSVNFYGAKKGGPIEQFVKDSCDGTLVLNDDENTMFIEGAKRSRFRIAFCSSPLKCESDSYRGGEEESRNLKFNLSENYKANPYIYVELSSQSQKHWCYGFVKNPKYVGN